MQMTIKRPFFGAVAGLALVLAGCGDGASFSGSAAKKSDDAVPVVPPEENPPEVEPPTPEPPPTDTPTPVTPYSALTWFWQCEANPGNVPPPKDNSAVVVAGKGPHVFEPGKVTGTPIIFEGRLCQPEELPRDIVFVIDTSGSMNGNDPRVGDSCGRLDAVRAVMASVPPGVARFGLVTFASLLGASSTAMFDTQDALFADLAPGGNIADVVCPAAGGTNYDAGLFQAGNVLQGGRPKATKEVYFISDGEPSGGQDGIVLANNLKTVGVDVGGTFVTATIATVMLNGNDQVMEQYIASRGTDGQPLHAFVNETGQLAQVLTALAANEIVGAELKYRPIGSAGEWVTVSLMDHIQDFHFTLPAVGINIDDAPYGLEVLYEYWDKHDNRYATGGKLVWKAASGDGQGS